MALETIWGIYARLFAAMYVMTFASLRAELVPLAGSRGISPVAEKLKRIREDMGAGTAWMRFPSLLWLGASDSMLRTLPLMGMLAGLLAVCGVGSNIMFAACWCIYLSFDVALGLTYPWESMLMEAGFLMMFLPGLHLLPSLRMSAAPQPLLMFAFHWLLFRVLFGFGRTKFTRDALKDPVYLRSFLISQPILSPFGWRAAKWPRPLLVLPHSALFMTEILLPFLVFLPGWPRLIPAAGFTALMIGIQLMGNFGFFNMLVVVLCVTLFDPRSVTAQTAGPLLSPAGLAVAAAAAWSIVVGLVHMPFNTWCARSWLDWPVWAKVKGAPGAFLQLLRAAMPFRTVHAYGVFPPRLGPPVKFIPVVEGTMDGEHWETFEYRYQPSTEGSRPPFVAPHCPRIDHLMLYEGYGLISGNFLGNIFSQGMPYDFSNVTILDRLLQRLMEEESPVRTLFRVDPFEGKPPKKMRMSLCLFVPAAVGEMKTSGRYWHRSWVGEHLRERGPDASIFQRWLPSPEQFHPDDRWVRRLVPRLRPLLSAADLESIRSVLPAETRTMWPVFWEAFIPEAALAVNAGWAEVDALALRLEQNYGGERMNVLDRIRGALVAGLIERLEPNLKVRSYFHLSLIAHILLLQGQNAAAAALQSGTCSLPETESEIESRGLMVFTLFKREIIRQHARKHRLAEQTLPPMAPPAEGLPGFSLTTHFLARNLPEPVERIPVLTQGDDGEWSLYGVRLN